MFVRHPAVFGKTPIDNCRLDRGAFRSVRIHGGSREGCGKIVQSRTTEAGILMCGTSWLGAYWDSKEYANPPGQVNSAVARLVSRLFNGEHTPPSAAVGLRGGLREGIGGTKHVGSRVRNGWRHSSPRALRVRGLSTTVLRKRWSCVPEGSPHFQSKSDHVTRTYNSPLEQRAHEDQHGLHG